MNITRVQTAVATIKECEAALNWLNEYAQNLAPRDPNNSVYISLGRGSAMPGADEAKHRLGLQGRFFIDRIVAATMEDCRDTITMEREAILAEVSP